MPSLSAGTAIGLLNDFAIVRRQAAAGNDEWVTSLPDLVTRLVDEWMFETSGAFTGGVMSVVFYGTVGPERQPAVLKVFGPGESAHRELYALWAAQRIVGPDVYKIDWRKGAVLMERLDQRLIDTSLSTDDQIRVAVASLRELWGIDADLERFESAQNWTRNVRSSLRGWWIDAGKPCTERLISRAEHAADEMISRMSRASDVMLMGDPHPGNLMSTRNGNRWKWIDFAGLRGPREFDLGKMMAGWFGDVNRAVVPIDAIRRQHRTIVESSDVNAVELWESGLFHRVAKGLHLHHIDRPEWGGPLLTNTEPMAIGPAFSRSSL